jgi:hypothetical protein
MTNPETSADVRAKIDEIDALMRDIFGCSLDEYQMCFFFRGYAQGEKAGRTAGRRAAKGLKERRKKRGRPLKIGDDLKALLIHAVKTREPETTIKEAVIGFLKVMQRGARELGDSSRSTLPSLKEALGAYYRHSRKPVIIGFHEAALLRLAREARWQEKHGEAEPDLSVSLSTNF